jgi:translocation and assembly module TamA
LHTCSASIKLLLITLLIMMAGCLVADELEIVVNGIKDPELSNVRNLVEPFRLIGVGRLTKRRLENKREASVQHAKEALRPFGYYHSTVNSKVRKTAQGTWVLELNIEPGPPLLIKELKLEIQGPGANLKELQEWKSDWTLTVGSRLIQPSWDEQKQRALEISSYNGYLLAKFASHQLKVDLDKNEASLTLILDTGEQAVMGEVTFQQDNVKPHVLENLARFKPGDPYNAWLLEKFRIDIWRTGYFGRINIKEERLLEETPPRVNLNVRAEPRKKNTYQGAIGFGSDTGPRGQFRWNRHLISRNGDNLLLATGWQQFNNEFFVRGNYRIPRNMESQQFWIANALLKKENEDVKVRENEFDDTEIKLANGNISDYSLRLGRLKVRDKNRGFRQLFETMYVELLNETADFKLNSGESPEAGVNFLSDMSEFPLKRTSQSISFGIEYDLSQIRGNGFNTSGQRNRAWAFTSNQSWGSDIDFSQVYISSRWNFIKGKRWKFLLRGEVGYTHADVNDVVVEIDDREIHLSVTELPNLYRFKAGGSNSVRGYNFESLSSNGVGSNNIITASAEVEMLIRPRWSLAAFIDTGNSFNDWGHVALKTGVGVGIRWYSIAGPIRVDIAQALDIPDKPWRLHFTIGTSLL